MYVIIPENIHTALQKGSEFPVDGVGGSVRPNKLKEMHVHVA